MRIVHLSTGHLGGAGLAARRLSAGLRSVGIDSKFVALSNSTYVPAENEFQIPRSLPQKLNSGFSTLFSQQYSGKSLVTPISTNLIDGDFLKRFIGDQKTVFHVHNWFNIFSQLRLAELTREFNFIFTLHDQRLFTGACHYSLGCEKFRTVCTNCPQLPNILSNLPSRAQRLANDFSDISFIAPSQWLFNLASSSNLLSNCRGQVIPNSFYGYEATVIEKRDQNSSIKVGLAAMNPKSWIKGGDIVTSLISKHSNGGFIQFFSLSDFAHHKDFWSTIDVLLVPSQADNSPNVIHEAKLWGIPVIASDVGGIPEILSEDFDSCISLESLTLNVIESEILRAYEFSNDIIARRRESERHRKYIDSSLERHIEFYKLLPSK